MEQECLIGWYWLLVITSDEKCNHHEWWFVTSTGDVMYQFDMTISEYLYMTYLYQMMMNSD